MGKKSILQLLIDQVSTQLDIKQLIAVESPDYWLISTTEPTQKQFALLGLICHFDNRGLIKSYSYDVITDTGDLHIKFVFRVVFNPLES